MSRNLKMLIGCMLPLLVFLVLALAGVRMPPLVIALVLIVCCLAMFYLMAGCGGHASHGQHHRRAASAVEAEPGSTPDSGVEIADVIEPTSRRQIDGVVLIEGELRKDADQAYETLRERFSGSEAAPLLQENEEGRPLLVLLPRRIFGGQKGQRSPWLNLVLFLATIATTTWAGAMHQGVDILQEPSRWTVGLPYSLSLIVILGAHELGHYFAARAHGIRVTLPYFIPAPFALGTFGAFIQLRSPSENRRALFDVGVAGPLAGLVFAVPALFIGLGMSQVLPPGEATGAIHRGADISSSALFAVMAKLALGEALKEGHVVVLHPLAFAGWLGLIVTALNLLPIGQLDGGHIADAMFGQRISAAIGMAAMLLLFALGVFVWSGLLFWALIVFFIAGRKGLPPLNNITRLDPLRAAIGWFAFIVLLAILVPVPHAFFTDLGIHCPYL